MRIHLIGVGGTGMGNLAALLAASGHEVRGSDSGVYPPMDSILAGAGIEVRKGYSPANLDPTPDLVVVGNICRPDHPEARAAIDRGIPIASMATTLHRLVLAGRRPIVVAGTHGKTTTTSMLVHVLSAAGMGPGFLVGGMVRGHRSGASPGAGPWFVVEGDEYDSAFFEKQAKFLYYSPDAAILTSVEHDHVDIYPTWDSYRLAFVRLAGLLGRRNCLVACADDPVVTEIARSTRARLVTYSTAEGRASDWHARDVSFGPDSTTFSIEAPSGTLGPVVLPMGGMQNVANAVAALAVAVEHAGVGPEVAVRAIGSFGGVARRQDVVGSARGVTVVEDFGHHPTAIGFTIDGLRSRVDRGGRIVAILRPASATGCRALHQDEYATALSRAEIAIIAPLGRKLPPGESLDLERLAADVRTRGRTAMLAPDMESISSMVAGAARPGDLVVVFSNSDTAALVKSVVEALSR